MMILLFPNIESGNVFFKASTHMGGGEIAAMVMGTKVHCVLTSRGDSSLTKLYSIALGVQSGVYGGGVAGDDVVPVENGSVSRHQLVVFQDKPCAVQVR